jgi:alkanesulfonate monooxygenase SsuD/methylene tetrahydromethanopterin reductase-like flavin-dependent oxidoreductase (luciferase family)
MKLGIHFPQVSGGAAAEEIARVAVRAEQTGYQSIWMSDHLRVPETGGNLPPIEIMEIRFPPSRSKRR